MSIEEVQGAVWSINGLFPVATPALIVSALVCFTFRRSSWIVPFWVFSVCPVFALLGVLVYMMLFSTRGYGPDGGFVGMATGFALMFSLIEVIPGILLICACPHKSSWKPLPALACIPTAALSIFAMFVGVRIATVPPMGESSATTFADDYLRATNAGTTDGFRKRAFVALLENPNTPNQALLKVGMELSDKSPLWTGLAKNPSLPRAVIEARISDPAIAMNLACNHSLPPEFLKILAESPNNNVRLFVSRNTSTPRESLEKLAQDSEQLVRSFARENLNGTLGAFAY